MPLQIVSKADDSNKHDFDVNNLLYHKGKLYSAGDDGKIKVWQPDLKFITEIQAHPCSVFCLAANDVTLYSCSNDGTVKSWELETLKEKKTLIMDSNLEFWTVRCVDNVLYVGDDQANIRIFKEEKSYGMINVAEPVKDMALEKNLLFSGRNQDIVVTTLNLTGEKIQFGVKTTLNGRTPIIVQDNKVIYISTGGKDLVLSESSDNKFKQVNEVKDAHEMIINALCLQNSGESIYVYSGGWEKILKKWKIENSVLILEDSCNVDIVINALVSDGEGKIFAAGGDGRIVCVKI